MGTSAPLGLLGGTMTALGYWITMTAIIGLFWVAMAMVAGFIEKRVR